MTLHLLTVGGAVTAFVLFGGIVLVAALMASPFGILFSNETSPDTIPLNAAVAEVGKEVCSTLVELQDGDYDRIDLTGALPGWREVIAVFAVRTAGAENGVDVATMDADRVDRLKAVFWDMTEITSEVDTIHHDGGENGEDWTEHILHLAVAAKSAEEMSTDYRFTAYQKKALAELLDDSALLDALLYDLGSLQYDAAMLRRALPNDLSKERRAVVERALSLAGKVNYGRQLHHRHLPTIRFGLFRHGRLGLLQRDQRQLCYRPRRGVRLCSIAAVRRSAGRTHRSGTSPFIQTMNTLAS